MLISINSGSSCTFRWFIHRHLAVTVHPRRLTGKTHTSRDGTEWISKYTRMYPVPIPLFGVVVRSRVGKTSLPTLIVRPPLGWGLGTAETRRTQVNLGGRFYQITHIFSFLLKNTHHIILYCTQQQQKLCYRCRHNEAWCQGRYS